MFYKYIRCSHRVSGAISPTLRFWAGWKIPHTRNTTKNRYPLFRSILARVRSVGDALCGYPGIHVSAVSSVEFAPRCGRFWSARFLSRTVRVLLKPTITIPEGSLSTRFFREHLVRCWPTFRFCKKRALENDRTPLRPQRSSRYDRNNQA